MPGSTTRWFSGCAVALLAHLVCPAVPVWAQNPDVATYTTAEGLPASQTLALLQDRAGYLWFGTTAGVARYDGAAFLVATRADGLTGNTIVALQEDSGGSILAAAGEGGVSLIQDGEIRALVSDGIGEPRVRAMARDQEGVIWLAADSGILQFRGGALSRLPLPAAAGLDSPRAIQVDRRGRVWVGDNRGLLEISQGRVRRLGSSGPVRAIVEDATGSIWVGTTTGLARLIGQQLESVEAGTVVAEVLSGLATPDGSVWFGTSSGAVRIERGGAVRLPTSVRGLRINALLVDHEGSNWFGTDSGAIKLVPSMFETLTTDDGLPADYVFAVRPGADGSVWVGTRAGIVRFDSRGRAGESILAAELGLDRLSVLGLGPGGELAIAGAGGLLRRGSGRRARFEAVSQGPAAAPTALLFRESGLWIGTERGLYRPRGRGFEIVGAGTRLATAAITSLAEDRSGKLWVGSRGVGVWSEQEAGFVSQPTADLRLDPVAVWALFPDATGGVWAATNGAGAVRFESGAGSVRLTRAGNGLASDFIQQIVVAADESVWLFTNRGLDRWDPAVGITHFDQADGLVSMSGNPGAGGIDQAGRLWLGTPRGLIVHRPGAAAAPAVPPIVVIESVRAGGELAAAEELVALPPRRADLTFEFTALSYREEASTRFQYRLRGHSEEWSRTTNERRVSYLRLPPGEYTFEVQAISGDGLWSAAPASVAVGVRPALWQMTWVRWALAAVGALAVAIVFRRRLRQVEAERRTLRVMVDERTRELVEKNTLLERMATTDELTGLPNRRFFLENLERELRKMTRLSTDQQLSLLVIDLDRFKSINDRFGHAAGDEVLRQVARRLGQGVRATDLAARYGGEEFAILLPNTAPPGARFLAEKLRADVENTQLRSNGSRIQVTISVGVATIAAPARYDPEVEEELLRRADEAMYGAKTGGRNRVVVADQSPA